MNIQYYSRQNVLRINKKNNYNGESKKNDSKERGRSLALRNRRRRLEQIIDVETIMMNGVAEKINWSKVPYYHLHLSTLIIQSNNKKVFIRKKYILLKK